MREKGNLRNLEQARRECQDRERWKLFCRGHSLVGAPTVEEREVGGVANPRASVTTYLIFPPFPVHLIGELLKK